MSAKQRSLAIVGLCLFLGGCGGEKLGTVTGVVKVDGKPVTQGTIMFIPNDGKAAVGTIGPDGEFTLTTYKTDDGALVGPHRVTILATAVGPSSLAPATLQDEIDISTGKGGGRVLVPGKVTWLVPERYSRIESTELTADVKPGSQRIDFDIPPQ